MSLTNKHDCKNINADGQVANGNRTLIAVIVSKAGGASDNVAIHNGTGTGDELVLTVFGAAVHSVYPIHRSCAKGIYANVTGTAEYIFVFD